MEPKPKDLTQACLIDKSFYSGKGLEICENSLSKQSTLSRDCKDLTQETSLNAYSKSIKDDLISFSYSKSNSVNTIREEHDKDYDMDLDERIKLMKKMNEIKDKSNNQSTRLLGNSNKRVSNMMEEYIKFKSEADPLLIDLSSSLISKSSVNPQILPKHVEPKQECSMQQSSDLKSEEKSNISSEIGNCIKTQAESKSELNWVNMPSKKQTLISKSYSSIKLDYPELERKPNLSQEYNVSHQFQNMKLEDNSLGYDSAIAPNYFKSMNHLINPFNNSILSPGHYNINQNTNTYSGTSFSKSHAQNYYYDQYYSQYGHPQNSKWTAPLSNQMPTNIMQQQSIIPSQIKQNAQEGNLNTSNPSSIKQITIPVDKSQKADSGTVLPKQRGKKYLENKTNFEVNLTAVRI